MGLSIMATQPIDNSAESLIANLQEKARAFMAEHHIYFDGDFVETGHNEQIKFAGIEGKSDKRCWLKCSYPETQKGSTCLCITFGAHDSALQKIITNTFYPSKNYTLTDEEKERFAEQRRQVKERERDEKKQGDETADWCINRIAGASSFEVSPYFEKKGVRPSGVYFEKLTKYQNCEEIDEVVALIPLRNIKGNIRAIQEIYPSKRKFKADDKKPRDKNVVGKYSGCFFTFGQLKDGDPIYIAEGYATAASIFESKISTTLMVVAATNIANVVKVVRERYPNSEIIICGDDDVDSKGNPGRTIAETVAREFNCKVIFPKFPEGKERDEADNARTDFNDLMLISGKIEVEKQIEQADFPHYYDDGDGLVKTDLSDQEIEGRPQIEILHGDIHRMTCKAEEVLCKHDSGIYQRGGQLVRIVTEKSKPNKNESSNKKSKIKRSNEALLIAEAGPIHLSEILDKLADWVKQDERTKSFKRKDCPEKVPKTLIARRQWNLPVLVGIIQAPTIREDGSILETPGYDRATGLFFNPGRTNFLPIPQNPNKDDAVQAKDYILSILSGFPFENEESKSVAMSAILTGLVRRTIRTAPLHGFTAPKMGIGKSLLADVVGLIATGKTNCVIPQAENEAEEKKRLLAVLAEGDPIICYDNIERPFGSPALCSVLSQTEFKDRLLGLNRSLSVPTNATFLATGNNLTFVGDISTRALLCRLDPQCERPEERSFEIDLKKYIPLNRDKLVQSALTMMRAYHVAGRPKQNIPQFGRFEDWSDLVRSSIVWVDMADPCASRKEIENSDPIRVSLGNLLSSWHEEFSDMSKRIKDVVSRAEVLAKEQKEQLLEALIEIAPDTKGGVNARSLGKKFANFKNRIENGYRLEKMGTYQGSETWRVTKVQ